MGLKLDPSLHPAEKSIQTALKLLKKDW
jgi:hypothetical protein